MQKKGDQYSANKLTDEDKNEIRALARDPRIGERRLLSVLVLMCTLLLSESLTKAAFGDCWCG